MTKTPEKTFPSNNKFVGQEQLASISTQAMDRIDELLDILGVELHRQERKYVGKCPVHGGDRDNAINLFHTGDSMVGNWKCRSHQCHQTFKPTLVGFVRGVLSHNELDWTERGDELIGFQETVDFLLKFLEKRYDDIKVDLSQTDRMRAADHVNRFYARKQKIKTKVPRSTIRKFIKTPTYYVERGFSAKILDKYDVTFCEDPSKPMYKRCVTPVYDDDHKFMVGCTGRSIYEKCEDCKSFHSPTSLCPLPDDVYKYSKWKHNYGFAAEEWLYNYWYAKNIIQQTKCAVLVESPGNVWRLEEAGVHVSLGLFGTSLTAGQSHALNKCGAMNVLLALDNDEAGKIAAQPLIEELSRLYNVEILDIEGVDIGEMSVDAVKDKLVPKIEGAYIQE